MRALLSTAYWPNQHYFYYVLHSESVEIEQFEHYGKQSYRNRTTILAANGALDLSIPVRHRETKELTKDIEISYQELWQLKHWRAITSAYRNAPYFEYFESEIGDFYKHKKYNLLLDYNLAQLQCLLKILKQKKTIQLTSEYLKINGETDLREKIHPKKKFNKDSTVDFLNIPYYQTFSEKHFFHPNLSTLDLIFNKGLFALEYLKL